MKILLGMSGGVDSAYAAHRLIEEGHSVEGAVLIMHSYTDVLAAEEAAIGIGIPLHKIDCRELFESRVVEDFISEYLSGRTPNPCIICNADVKMRVLYDYAISHGFDAIATGHYARVTERRGDFGIKHTVSKAGDKRKDQSYMLYRLSEDILSRLYLPLMDKEKSDVKKEAAEIGISAADRGESQEICFIPDNDHAAFIEGRTAPSPRGHYINKEGKILGEHSGIIRYTVGQRKGLGIAMGKRVFVTEINAENNTVTLSDEDKVGSKFAVRDMVFPGISEPKINEKLSLSVKVRYLAPPVSCTLEYLGGGRAEVKLDVPQRAITPGQSAVFYDGDDVAAGGFIL